MRSKFPGYFKLKEDNVNELWKDAIFTFDANILLNLYRYSDETRDEYFKILQKIKARIWLPHQCVKEYFNNRLNVIRSQEKSYEEAIKSLNTQLSEFENTRNHPFLTTRLLEDFKKLKMRMTRQLEKQKEIIKAKF